MHQVLKKDRFITIDVIDNSFVFKVGELGNYILVIFPHYFEIILKRLIILLSVLDWYRSVMAEINFPDRQ